MSKWLLDAFWTRTNESLQTAYLGQLRKASNRLALDLDRLIGGTVIGNKLKCCWRFDKFVTIPVDIAALETII